MNTINTYLFPLIAALVVFVLAIAATQLANRQNNVKQRVRRMADAEEVQQLAVNESFGDPLRNEPKLSPLGLFFDQIFRGLGMDTDAYRKKHQMMFYRAGLQTGDAPFIYLFFKRIMVVFFLLGAVYIATRTGESFSQQLQFYVAAALVACAGIMGPDMYLKNRRLKRQKILQRSFPDALDLLLVCVESGLALDGALARVCKELGRARPEITMELNKTRLELTLLNDRSQALANLGERTDMVAFRSLVSTLLQSEKFGTSLTETLRVLSEDHRNTRLMLAEDKAGRLPVLMTIPLITLMMPALFIIILGPAMLRVTKTFADMH